MSDDTIRAVDLFCGAGGLSWGLVEALREVAIDADQPTEEYLAETIDLVGVNHWETAIQTHERNHPWARHFHDDVANVSPSEVFPGDDPDVTILSGGIECTHWSSARGGKPVDEQKRMPAWDALTWVQKLRPDVVLFENVKEFQSWGNVEDGTPTRDGSVFPAWIDGLHAHGYSVDWNVLCAADYGDPTSRERLFIVGRRDGVPEWPAPTHAEDPDPDDRREPWRTAADIIDWSDPGGSIWTRDLHDGRVKPLKYTTMRRIAEGIRRHCDDRLEPFADALHWIGRVEARDDVDPSQFTSVEELRERAVPAHLAGAAAELWDEPFLVAQPDCRDEQMGLCAPSVLGQHSNSVPRHVGERPAPTVATGGKLQLVSPLAFLLRQQSDGTPSPPDQPVPTISKAGAIARVGIEGRPLVMPKNGKQRGLHSNSLYPPEEQPHHTVTADPRSKLVTPSLVRYSHGGASLGVHEPMPTIATEKGGVFALSAPEPYLCPLYNGRDGQRPRTRDVDRPLMTVPASKVPAGLSRPEVVPFIDDFEGAADPVDEPLGTITARDRFALVLPECYPWGLDVRYRMLTPRELARAQGFPDEYDFAGTKTDTTEQIGNAVPVNLARALVTSLLRSTRPSLRDYLDPAGTEPEVRADGSGREDGDAR